MTDFESKPVRLFLWVVPRTISTALCKCLSAIDGMEVWFECFVPCNIARKEYLLTTGEEIPMDYEGNEERAQEAATKLERLAGSKVDPERIMYGHVKRKMESSTSKYILAKEGAFIFPDDKSRQYLPKGFKHVFLIRDPYRIFDSYRKAMVCQTMKFGLWTADPESFDLEKDDPYLKPPEFFSSAFETWKYIRDNVDPNPIVINTDDLLADPAGVLEKFCHLTGLPYSDSLLKWDASADITKTWKVTVDKSLEDFGAFYDTAKYSDGFMPPRPATPVHSLESDVKKLANASMPYFKEMNKYKI
nr:uncharacterized protein LOC129279294 [Lytechinus pictus]